MAAFDPTAVNAGWPTANYWQSIETDLFGKAGFALLPQRSAHVLRANTFPAACVWTETSKIVSKISPGVEDEQHVHDPKIPH
jgi:hypothetical protein